MLSAPSTIANISAITLRPAFAAPGRSRRSRTSRPANASIPSRSASVATSITPASETTRSIVELDPHTVQSDRLVILHHEGDLLSAGPGCSNQPLKPCTGGHSSFTDRTEPTYRPGGSGFRLKQAHRSLFSATKTVMSSVERIPTG